MTPNTAARISAIARAVNSSNRCAQCVSFSYMTFITDHKVLHGMAPPYLGPFIHVADLPSRRALQSGLESTSPDLPQSVAGPFRFPDRRHGTSCPKTLKRRRHCQSSGYLYIWIPVYRYPSVEFRLSCNFVVDVDTVCLSKAPLDKFWMHRDVIYDFTADLTGIGDRSVRESS